MNAIKNQMNIHHTSSIFGIVKTNVQLSVGGC